MPQPAVSVVIPTYKGVGDIMNAVHSVAAQTFRDFETIVVIDGSTDGTRELLECYRATLPEPEQDRFRIIWQDNAGVSAARNAGMRAASGDYIALLDGDDTWHPEKLSAQMAEIAQHPGQNHVFCTCDHVEVSKNGVRKPHDNANSLTMPGFIKHSGAQPGTWVFSKSIFTEKVGGFDEQMCVVEDSDYLIRMMGVDGIARLHVPRALVDYKWDNPDSLSSGNITPAKLQSFARLLEKHHDTLKAGLPPDLFEEKIMNWHRKNQPPELLARTMAAVEARRARAAAPAARTDKKSDNTPGQRG